MYKICTLLQLSKLKNSTKCRLVFFFSISDFRKILAALKHFANLCKAYDALPDRLKVKLSACTALQEYYSGTVMRGQNIGQKNGSFAHPVITAHEETSKPVLFISRLITVAIPELSSDEQIETLEFLFKHTEKPEFIYEHQWSLGDFVMWDNRCVNHARRDFPSTQRRLLRRNVIQGTQPKRATI